MNLTRIQILTFSVLIFLFAHQRKENIIISDYKIIMVIHNFRPGIAYTMCTYRNYY